ncbi:MAG: DHA2 family efflux MFS transporter permease subunit [Acetobacteraceae bacterium]|nr:DHA2 family efflux MFS transporter permease subunit [Acetobacteraceae bacterium]
MSAEAGRALRPADWIGFMAMVVGMFMAILDIQIVSASIAEIQAGLSAGPDEVAWVQTSYLIAEIVMIPLSGWLSRLLSTRILFVTSALGFAVFSALCATAASLPEMIVYRALQGFLGGAMIPTVFATTFLLFPPEKRGQVSVLIGLTATLAPTIGPTLGGWLTQTMSWHWLFLINVPVGLVIAGVVFAAIRLDRPDWSLWRSFDLAGLVLLALFLGSLEYVLEEGERAGWFEDGTILGFTVICGVAGALFLHRMLARAAPLVDLRAFRNGNFAFGCVFSLVMGVGLYGSVYVVPLFLARVRGYDAMQIGEVMFATGAAMFLSAPVVGRLSRSVDLRKLLALGLAGFAVAVWWMAHLTSQSSFADLLGPQAMRGVAMMLLIVPVNQLALGTMAPGEVKNASGLYNLMRNLGGAIGLALINYLATTRYAAHALHLSEQVNWARPGATRMLEAMTRALTPVREHAAHLGALKRIGQLVRREALTLSYNDVLLMMALAFLLALPLTLLLKRPGPAGGAVEAH